jgi:hypothetical protein
MVSFNKGSFNIQLQGYTPANRDAVVKLVNQSTGQVIERKPFLDGSLVVRDVDPGLYQLEVTHPNLITPITQRPIRLIPQITPTFIPVIVPPDLFRDTPIRDVPDKDLTPVQQAAAAAKAQLQPIASKAPGEVIRAADWNALVDAVIDLANSVSELTQLVTPKGHDHPELEEKFDEVQGNIRRFVESFGKSLLELRRDIETQRLRHNVEDVLVAAGANDAVRTRLIGRVANLEQVLQADTSLFTRTLTLAGNQFLTEINELATQQGAAAETFLQRPEVVQLTTTAQSYVQAGTQVRPEAELATYNKTLSAALKGRT